MKSIAENIDLKRYTYFKVGGPVRYFVEAGTVEDLREAVKFALARSLPILIIGGASNILVSDGGFRGLAIKILINGIQKRGNKLTVGAGMPMAAVVSRAVQENLSGMEWAVGIPGTVGGSVRGNAGAFGGEVKDVLDSVEVFNIKTGEVEVMQESKCKFRYRDSVFKTNPHLVILGATFKLRNGNPKVSQAMMRHYARSRTNEQDIGISSAGCIFKNARWPADEKLKERLLWLIPDLKDFETRLTIPAGILIERAGLKEKRIGGAIVSKKHANFILNDGSASAEDILMLISAIKENVHRKFDIFLEEEIQYAGFD